MGHTPARNTLHAVSVQPGACTRTPSSGVDRIGMRQTFLESRMQTKRSFVGVFVVVGEGVVTGDCVWLTSTACSNIDHFVLAVKLVERMGNMLPKAELSQFFQITAVNALSLPFSHRAFCRSSGWPLSVCSTAPLTPRVTCKCQCCCFHLARSACADQADSNSLLGI